LGTASYAITAATSSFALTASYIAAAAVKSGGVLGCLRTGSFVITDAATWYDLSFNVNMTTSSYWTHQQNTSAFTCSVDGFYQIFYWINLAKTTGGSAQAGGCRMTKNGGFWTGSFVSFTYASNNVGQLLASSMIDFIPSGSRFSLQVASNINSNFSVLVQPTSSFGTLGTTSYSAKILFNRVT
jgi:hypothetical protein